MYRALFSEQFSVRIHFKFTVNEWIKLGCYHWYTCIKIKSTYFNFVFSKIKIKNTFLVYILIFIILH